MRPEEQACRRGTPLGFLWRHQCRSLRAGHCALGGHQAATHPFSAASSLHRVSDVPLQLTIHTHLAYTSRDIGTDAQTVQILHLSKKKKKSMQPNGSTANLINKWATVPKKHSQAELLTTMAASVTSEPISRFRLLRLAPHNDPGRLSPMKRLPLGISSSHRVPDPVKSTPAVTSGTQ